MEPDRHEYRAHVIELRQRPPGESPGREAKGDEDLELVIDGRTVGYGRLPDGTYFLEEYAYDWTDDLVELAHRFVDHRARTESRARDPRAGED